MKTSIVWICLFLLLLKWTKATSHDGREDSTDYFHDWVVHLETGTSHEADEIASNLEYENLGEISGFENYFLFRKMDHPHLLRSESTQHTKSLEDEVQVIFAQQLFHKKRVKRRVFIIEEDKRLTNELLNLWHKASSMDQDYSPLVTKVYSDPLWMDEWYMVIILNT